MSPLDSAIVSELLLHGANFSGANLSGVIFDHPTNDLLDAQGWASAIWTGAFFHYPAPPSIPDGMNLAESGITVYTPEPASLLLSLIALCVGALSRRRKSVC